MTDNSNDNNMTLPEGLYIDPDTGQIIGDPTPEEQRFIKTLVRYVSSAVNENMDSARISAAVKMLARFSVDENTIEALRDLRDNLQGAQDLIQEIDDLEPYLTIELKKPEYGGATIKDLLSQYEVKDLTALPPDSLLYKALEAAREVSANIERTTARRADFVEYPLDKPNSYVWNLLEEQVKKNQVDGQLVIDFDMKPAKSQLQARATYAINFNELGDDLRITKQLDPFDKRVYVAAGALFNAGNNITTVSQIYHVMGYTGNLGDVDRNKINTALTKMSGAKIYVDNEKEATALNGYTHFRYDGSLLPMERLTAIVNGQIVEQAVKLFREPPLISFAKQRKQLTTIDAKLLQSPISKTNENLSIEDYLLERISKAKNGKNHSCRILYKTLFDRAHITGKQRQRAPKKIERYLNYYEEMGFITKHTTQRDGVTVYY